MLALGTVLRVFHDVNYNSFEWRPDSNLHELGLVTVTFLLPLLIVFRLIFSFIGLTYRFAHRSQLQKEITSKLEAIEVQENLQNSGRLLHRFPAGSESQEAIPNSHELIESPSLERLSVQPSRVTILKRVSRPPLPREENSSLIPRQMAQSKRTCSLSNLNSFPQTAPSPVSLQSV